MISTYTGWLVDPSKSWRKNHSKEPNTELFCKNEDDEVNHEIRTLELTSTEGSTVITLEYLLP